MFATLLKNNKGSEILYNLSYNNGEKKIIMLFFRYKHLKFWRQKDLSGFSISFGSAGLSVKDNKVIKNSQITIYDVFDEILKRKVGINE